MPRHREARHDTTYLVVRGAGAPRVLVANGQALGDSHATTP
jgi:hypothetical protein